MKSSEPLQLILDYIQAERHTNYFGAGDLLHWGGTKKLNANILMDDNQIETPKETSQKGLFPAIILSD